MMLEITYFRAELVQLTVSWSDSELDVQRYGKILSCWKMNCEMRLREKQSANRQNLFENRELQKLSFWFLNCEVSSVRSNFQKSDIQHFHRFPHTVATWSSSSSEFWPCVC